MDQHSSSLNSSTILSVRELSASYLGKTALWNINFQMKRGHILGIIGPNGSGKSTLLKSIVQLNERDTGEIKYFGSDDFESCAQKIAYLPQRESLDWNFPIKVIETVVMGRYPKMSFFQRPGENEYEQARVALEKVKLLDCADQAISELSGGQQQRVLIARALCQDADLILLDEPFAAVDMKTEELIKKVLSELRSENRSVMIVNQDLFSVQNWADEVLLLNTRQVRFGPCDETLNRKYLEECYGSHFESFSNALELSQKSRN